MSWSPCKMVRAFNPARNLPAASALALVIQPGKLWSGLVFAKIPDCWFKPRNPANLGSSRWTNSLDLKAIPNRVN